MKERLASGKLRCTWLEPTFVGCPKQCKAIARAHAVGLNLMTGRAGESLDLCSSHVDLLHGRGLLYESWPISADHVHETQKEPTTSKKTQGIADASYNQQVKGNA